MLGPESSRSVGTATLNSRSTRLFNSTTISESSPTLERGTLGSSDSEGARPNACNTRSRTYCSSAASRSSGAVGSANAGDFGFGRAGGGGEAVRTTACVGVGGVCSGRRRRAVAGGGRREPVPLPLERIARQGDRPARRIDPIPRNWLSLRVEVGDGGKQRVPLLPAPHTGQRRSLYLWLLKPLLNVMGQRGLRADFDEGPISISNQRLDGGCEAHRLAQIAKPIVRVQAMA